MIVILWCVGASAQWFSEGSSTGLSYGQESPNLNIFEIKSFRGIDDYQKILERIDQDGLPPRGQPSQTKVGAQTRWFELSIQSLSQGDSWIFSNELPLSSMIMISMFDRRVRDCNQASSQETKDIRIHIPYCKVELREGENIFLVGVKSPGNLTRMVPFFAKEDYFWKIERFRLEWILALSAAMIFIIFYEILVLMVERKAFIFYIILSVGAELLLISNLIGIPRLYSLDLQIFLSRHWPLQLMIVLGSASLALVSFFSQLGESVPWLDRLIRWMIVIYGIITVFCVFFPEEGSIPYLFIAFLSSIILSWRSLMILKISKKMGIFYILSIAPTVVSAAGLIFSYIFKPEYYFWCLFSLLGGTLVYFISLSVIFGATAREARVQKSRMEQGLELGRHVQSFLLPHLMERRETDGEYLFKYVPYQMQMSGDWINHWISQDGTLNFIIGDVTGKGPQAALAVAMISTIINYHQSVDSDLLTCIEDINRTLFQSFTGQITTTATAVAIHRQTQRAVFMNAAGCGWFLSEGQRQRHILGKGSLLGLGKEFVLEPISFDLKPGDCFFTLTDGLCPSNRYMKRLFREIPSYSLRDRRLDEISALIFRFARQFNSQDDQAFFIYRRSGVQEFIQKAA